MFFLVIVSCIWALSFPLIKAELAGVDPLFVSSVRLTLSAVCFLPFVDLRGLTSRTIAFFAWIGAVQFGFMYAAYISAYRFLPAHMIALLTITTPIFVYLFANVFKKASAIRSVFAITCAVAGGAVAVIQQKALSGNLVGFALILFSNACFAYGQTAYVRIKRTIAVDDARIFGVLYAGGTAAVVLMSLCTRGSLPSVPALSLIQWSTLVYLSVISSAVGFWLWNKGAGKVRPALLSVMNNLKIPIGMLASFICLHETTDLRRLSASIILIGLGIALSWSKTEGIS